MAVAMPVKQLQDRRNESDAAAKRCQHMHRRAIKKSSTLVMDSEKIKQEKMCTENKG